MLGLLHTLYARLLEAIVLLLISSMAILVVAGFSFRRFGAALIWYDEVAALLLCWLTFYGAALAALRRAHMAVPGLVLAMPLRLRLGVGVMVELLTIGFMALLIYYAMQLQAILIGPGLASVRGVSLQMVQSAIPIGATLFIISQLITVPAVFRALARGQTYGDEVG